MVPSPFFPLSTAKIDLSLTRNKNFQCFTQQNPPSLYSINCIKFSLRIVKDFIKALVPTAAAVLEPDVNPSSFLEQIKGPKEIYWA